MREVFQYVGGTEENQRVVLYLAGISYCDGTYRIRRSPQKMTVLEFVEQGRGSLRVEDSLLHPAAGDVYIAPAWKAHEYWSSSESPWVKYWFNLGGPWVETLLSSYNLNETYLFPDAGEAGRLILSGVRALDRIPRNRLDAFLETRIFQIVQALSRGMSKKTADSDPARLMAARLTSYLRSRVFQPTPSLEEIAAVIGRSPAQTIRIFRAAQGMTPVHFLLVEKVRAALELLRGTRKTVKETARILGFRDEYYFSRVFRKIHGIPPGECRVSPPKNS